MDANKIVVHVEDRQSGDVVLYFLAEGIRKPGIASVSHADGEIVALHEGRRYLRGIRLADHRDKFAADALCGAVALLAFLRFRVNLLKLSIVNLHPESLLYGWQVHVQSVTCELYAVTQAAR